MPSDLEARHARPSLRVRQDRPRRFRARRSPRAASSSSRPAAPSKALAEAGLPVRDVSDLTGFPEMMDGRVKTLHPAVHGGLLGVRANPEHQAAMLAHGIAPDRSPRRQSLPVRGDRRRRPKPYDDCIENIDIGGPAMIRAAAKNHARRRGGGRRRRLCGGSRTNSTTMTGAVTLALRRRLAQKAYARTAAYDAAISNWLADEIGEADAALPRARRRAGRGHALRREPAPDGRLLPHARTARPASRRRARCRASSSPTTTSTTPTPPTRRRRVRARALSRRRHRQARQSLRRRRRRQACARPTRRRCAATRSPPSAASSR